jgi:hypothetical protein
MDFNSHRYSFGPFYPSSPPPPLHFWTVCFLQTNLIGLIRYNMMYACTHHAPVHQPEENVNNILLNLCSTLLSEDLHKSVKQNATQYCQTACVVDLK